MNKNTKPSKIFNMIIETIPELKKLSTSEKLILTNESWDSLSSKENTLPVLVLHEIILDNCLKDHEANPKQGSPWKEVKSKILKKNDS